MLKLYGPYGEEKGIYRQKQQSKQVLTASRSKLDVICTGLHVLFTGQILHKQLLNLLKSTVYTITNVARCSARQLRAPPQHSPYAPAAPTRLAGQGRTHRHHLPLPPYSLSESLAAKAQPQ
jgi:hypothetical protein